MFKTGRFSGGLPGWLIVLIIVVVAILVILALIGLPYLGCYITSFVPKGSFVLITKEQCYIAISNLLKTPLILFEIVRGVFR